MWLGLGLFGFPIEFVCVCGVGGWGLMWDFDVGFVGFGFVGFFMVVMWWCHGGCSVVLGFGFVQFSYGIFLCGFCDCDGVFDVGFVGFLMMVYFHTSIC